MGLRKLTKNDVEFVLTIEDDDTPLEGAFSSDDPEADRNLVKELKHRLDRGDVWAWCTVIVTARWKNWRGIATLGACSYDDEADFKSGGGYYEGMCEDAVEDLNNRIHSTAESLKELEVV